MMGFDLTLPLRIAQLIFNIIVLGCAARGEFSLYARQ